ncbi:MAG TPA: hypothetical protein PLY87_28445 [Planctomycetaceae bacterium]|nr:hypothetical protein [Planctomycetaceae bacterium]HQZ69063.1 hypothetical protein [Planctomycetaceae bacterium]HRA87716.1 hypothetical protein [Planctomycetaceae bacterium]
MLTELVYRTCCEPDCTFAWYRPADAKPPEIVFGLHYCTHGTYWTIFAGVLPDGPDGVDTAQLLPGSSVLRGFWSAELLSVGTCRFEHGASASADFNQPAALAVA